MVIFFKYSNHDVSKLLSIIVQDSLLNIEYLQLLLLNVDLDYHITDAIQT